jgi:hypothetical protein
VDDAAFIHRVINRELQAGLHASEAAW